MRQKLFPNIKRMTNLFCAGMILITVTMLVSRLTFLSGTAARPISSLEDAGVPMSEVGDSQQEYTINRKIYFADAEAKGNILITNKDTNENYIRVDLRLDSTGKSVYYSGDIAPGTLINSVRLQGDLLDEGVYECTAIIAAYDPDTKDKTGEDQIPVSLYIKVKPDRAK